MGKAPAYEAVISGGWNGIVPAESLNRYKTASLTIQIRACGAGGIPRPGGTTAMPLGDEIDESNPDTYTPRLRCCVFCPYDVSASVPWASDAHTVAASAVASTLSTWFDWTHRITGPLSASFATTSMAPHKAKGEAERPCHAAFALASPDRQVPRLDVSAESFRACALSARPCGHSLAASTRPASPASAHPEFESSSSIPASVSAISWRIDAACGYGVLVYEGETS